MVIPRFYHTAQLVKDRFIIVMSGYNDMNKLLTRSNKKGYHDHMSDCECYDTHTNESFKTQSLPYSRNAFL